jgi:hypothetical protein
MQPVITAPWPEEEVAFLKNLQGMQVQYFSGKKEFCKTMTDDLLAVQDIEYVPPVHYSLFYDTEEMSELLGDCFYKLDLDNPSYINLKPPVMKFADGFRVFMGNYDNFSENGNEVIIIADGWLSRYAVENVQYRQQLRIKDIDRIQPGVRIFVLSPAEACSEKYNKEILYAYGVDIDQLMDYAALHQIFSGVFRYGGREYVYVFGESFGMSNIEIRGKEFSVGQASSGFAADFNCGARFK